MILEVLFDAIVQDGIDLRFGSNQDVVIDELLLDIEKIHVEDGESTLLSDNLDGVTLECLDFIFAKNVRYTKSIYGYKYGILYNDNKAKVVSMTKYLPIVQPKKESKIATAWKYYEKSITYDIFKFVILLIVAMIF